MKSRFWMQWIAVCLFMGGTTGFSADYYINDVSTNLDVYTSAIGHDANPGTASAPKRSLNNVIATLNLQPGDGVYIDTGTYTPCVISNTVDGTDGNRILFQGSTNGSTFTGSGYIFDIRGSYLNFRDLRALGGSRGVALNAASFCEFEQFSAISNSLHGLRSSGAASSNTFRQCIFVSQGASALNFYSPAKGNYIENSIMKSENSVAFSMFSNTFSNVVGCIAIGGRSFGSAAYTPQAGVNNIFFQTGKFHDEYETVADLQRAYTNWVGNTFVDPKFLNVEGLDFHLLSAAGFVSNGVWVTNSAVGYSPAIDFGSSSNMAYTNEPSPNGSRVNVGLFGGTDEASKSRTDDWVFAMTFNDGGALIQTGRLEWVGGNLGAGATVDLQFSTNNGTSWSDIATGVNATDESHTWTPAFSYPAVLWRVFSSTNTAAASTNAKLFSVRLETNTVFSFYVNDGSTNNDIYCSVLGNNANDGVTPASPKASLQAILEAYDLEGGDTVYVDTGDYLTNVTTTITSFDSGSPGNPLRIIGSPAGSVLRRGSTSANTLSLDSVEHLEFENLQLSDGSSGLYGAGSSDIVLRDVHFTDNRYGVSLSGACLYYRFEGCLAADNTINAFSGTSAEIRFNQWLNGVMWGSPTLIMARTNSLTVSNSILGGATALFGQNAVYGDYNLVWDSGMGLTYSSLSDLEEAGFGWERSLFADPQFADLDADDFHLKSEMGRFDPATGFFTNDVVHSPAIDLGNPTASVGDEPAPNGSRLNVGLYAGSLEASKSRTNAWLQTLSFMEGGTLDAPVGAWLRWNGGNYPPSSTVTLWLSRNGGSSWETLVAGVTATNGGYFYSNTSTNDSSSLYALWKVTLEGVIPEVASTNSTNFTYKNGPFSFYVNDASTNGDVYCTAIGDDGNLGVTDDEPMATLSTLLDRYQLGAGDRIYVDTGSYEDSAATSLTALDSGTEASPVLVLGSTNVLAGGSVFGRRTVTMAAGFIFQVGASNIILRDMVLTNVTRGVAISDSVNITLERITVHGGKTRAFDLNVNSDNVEMKECVAHGGGVGVGLQQATNIVIRQCLFWQNEDNAVYVGSQVGLLLENSILASTNPATILYSTASWNGFSSDYNNIDAGLNTRVGVYRSGTVYADNLAAWNALSSGLDAHSIPGNPQMADPENFDYHLKTEQTLGRFLPSGEKTSDALSSPLLDAGNPMSDFSAEPPPNGSRINIGRYGGTEVASIALSTPWIKAASFGDGGAVEDGGVPLVWIAGGGFSNETVKVDVSVDGGQTWDTSVVSGIPATNGAATWTVSGLSDTPAAVWRVSCLENTNIVAQSSAFFAIRNNPLNLYVNDSDTNETVYTTGAGRTNNWMATSNAPLSSLLSVFEHFDLEAGDQIWVDTGTFEESDPIVIGLKNSGTSTNPVRVTGNSLFPYSGTVLKQASRSAGSYGLYCAYAGGITFDSLTVSNAWIGLYAERSQSVSLNRIRVGYCVNSAIYAGTDTGMDLRGGIVEQSLYAGLHANTGAVVTVFNSLIRNNSKANIYLRGGNVEVKNSVMEASGSQRFIYYWMGEASSLVSDYNNIRVENSANVSGGESRASDRFLIDWQVSTAFSNDVRSFGYDADFADEDDLDFHLKSEYGRYDPAGGAYVTNDVTTSHLIDLGDTSAYSNEPAPNGSRINVGLYGNTVEASKSSTQGALVPLTMSDGGTIRGEATLYWSWNGISPIESVNVDFSPDDGVTWTNIDTVFASVGSLGLAWSTTNFPSTALGVWRVCTTNEPAICGQTETLFAIKNNPLAYYINDASTNGDVYCTAPGSSSNDGLTPATPKLSLEALLGEYKIEPGDTIYIDTGIYSRSTPLVIKIDTVAPTNYLLIQGSTNYLAGGSIYTNSGAQVIEIQNTRNLEMRDLQLKGGGSEGLLFTQADSNRLFRIRSVGARGNAFALEDGSDQNQFIQCAALNFFKTGFHVASPIRASIPPSTNQWISGVISSVSATSNGVAKGTGTLMGVQSGRIYVSNSVFVANGPAHIVYMTASNVIRGDYNCYYLPDTNSGIAEFSSTTPPFGIASRSPANWEEWTEWTQSDSNSMVANPLFADLEAGDLHPKSVGGRYSVAAGDFVPDTVSSPLLDGADPAMPWGNETEPNGSRANMGVYGNTAEASRTSTNGTFSLLTLNHGGMVQGDQMLKWLVRGGATNPGHLINIQLSTNSGAGFQTIGTALAADREYLWNSLTNPSVATARWRIRSQSQSSWSAESERDFTIHNTNLIYYVNDASLSNDVYTTAIGAPENSGRSPSSPLSSLADVIVRYDLEAGDIVLIDTGDYSESDPVEIGYTDSGTVAQPIQIQGSTNYPGSILMGSGISLENTKGIQLSHLRFQSQPIRDVISIAWSEDISLSEIDVSGGGTAFGIMTSSNVFLQNFSALNAATNGVASQASFNTRIETGTLWSNQVAQVLTRNQLASGTVPAREASFVTVSNCVMGAFGTRISVYETRGSIYANYNNLYLANGALASLSYESVFGVEYDSVGGWSSSSGQDLRTLSHDPKFENSILGDVHLKSSAGRFDPETGTFVNDAPEDTSPLIDAGDPLQSCIEPLPNGDRMNLGRYANTEQASKTPTNGTLTLISFNDGGRAAGTNVLITWNVRGFTTNAGVTVTIFYSADAGITWSQLVAGVSASTGSWVWDSTLSEQSVQALLKIEGSDGTVVQSDKFFTVGGPFVFYINDSSTDRDVYCSAVGNTTNSGLEASAPMANLNTLLAKYDLEGGDIVYIDTGVYRGLDPWQITQTDTAGSLTNPPVVFQGSTNSILNGTVLDRSFNDVGIQIDYGVGVQIRNIMISNTVESAVSFYNCYGAEAEWIAVGAGNVAFSLSGGSQMRVANSVVFDVNQGVLVGNWTKATNTVFPVIENNVFWEMSGSAIEIASENSATLRNNILSVEEGEYIYELGTTADLTSDYNAIWLESGGRVSRREVARYISPVPVIYDSVGTWAAATGQDVHTYSGDPVLADPDQLDFHLQSQAGRWVPSAGSWTNDSGSSPLIDAGDPDSAAWTNEPAPNGDHVNVGLYGGSIQASKSSTNSALNLLSLNQGGVASGQVELSWTPSGLATGHTVRLEVSADNGDSWILVVDGVPASLGGVTWNSLVLPSSPLALWRVSDEVETNIFAMSETNFVLHNGPISYYVNDEFTVGDIYCGAVGDSGNSGVSPDSPKRWISEIIETFNLEPGDVVYVDTGIYQTSDTTTFGDLDAGEISQDPSQQITILGSTNELDGGSLYIFSDAAQVGIQLDETYGIRFKYLNLLGGSNGLAIDDSYFIAAEWMKIRGCQNAARINSSSNVLFTHSSLVGNQQAAIRFYGGRQESLDVDSCLIWSNRVGVDLHGGYVGISNSILGMLGPNSYGYYVQSDAPQTGLRGDYNNLYVGTPGAAVAGLQTGNQSSARTSVYYSVSAWATASGQDVHSLPHNPELVAPENEDYHLQSSGGRYELGSGWVYDTNSSPLIDAGNPQSTNWITEPSPDGRRVNIGLYGGSVEASKMPGSGWLTLVSFNDGGRASGEVNLQWTVGGAATNYSVCIEYSPDDGLSWTNIVCGWPANSGSYVWDSVPFGRSALARWRAYCMEDLSIFETSLLPFVMDNGGSIPYYVNDDETVGDVYCTAIGDDSNSGLLPSAPKANLQAILDTYALSPEDVVYVDSGNYVAGAPPIIIDQTDSGWSNLFVTIQGSTNPVVATLFSSPSFSAPNVFSLQYAVNIRLKDLTIRNASIGLEAYQTIGCELINVRIENNRAIGLNLTKSENFGLQGSILWKNSSSTGGVAVLINQGSLSIENCVLWGSPRAVSILLGSLSVTNSALDATGADGRIYLFSKTASAQDDFAGDYNSYFRRNGALIAEQKSLVGGSEFYNDLSAWNRDIYGDYHTMTLDPEFENEITGDFHPKSTKGRYNQGVWTNDVTLSPLVDAGSPTGIYTNEPAPNGAHINIGAYGNSPEASMTQTNPPWLHVISYNEEGVMSEDVLLYWLHGGMTNGSRVRLEYSTDYEVSWSTIVTNLLAETREYAWDVSTLPLSLALNWRVVLESNTNVWDVSDYPVSLKTETYDFFINDSSTNGDVWCTGPGLPWDPIETYGTNAATPLESLQSLLTHYPVGGGDRVFIDTGFYSVSDDSLILLDDQNTGTPTAPLRLYGSTNVLAGGTLFQGNGTANGIEMQNTRNIELYDLRIGSAQNGVALENVSSIILQGLELFNGVSNGVWISNGADVECRNMRLWGNSHYGYAASFSQSGWRNILESSIWGNRLGALWADLGVVNVSNSILCVTNATPVCSEIGIGSFMGDYNMYGLVSGSVLGTNAQKRVVYQKLSQWQIGGRDGFSVVADPFFVDPAAGEFHLQSRAGNWNNGVWTNSSDTSWAIDAGDPSSLAYTNETPPDGGRLNIGAYAGTGESSASDSSQFELFPVSLRDGGVAPDGQLLYWLFRGLNATNTIRIEFSPDAGASWELVDSGIPVGSAPYAWYGACNPSPEALWRIILESDTNVLGATSTPFIYRPCPLTYYVNDDSRVGDVYTTAVGSSTNRGYVSNSPLPSIQAVLSRYQLIGGDEIKVDTGIYELSEPVLITVLNSGDTTNRVKFTGSTNWAADGSWFQAAPDMLEPAFLIYGAHDVDLSNFRISGFTNGLSIMEYATRCNITEVEILESTDAGILIDQSTAIHFQRVLVHKGWSNGIVALSGRLVLDSCVLWSNRTSAIVMGDTVQLGITNCVLEASGVGDYCYDATGTNVVISANYNNLYIQEGAQIAFLDGLQYEKLPQWVREIAQDRYSLSTDPFFHDSEAGDFHLRSTAGRYEVGTGWIQDSSATNLPDFSPMIDMGFPQTAWSNEPTPNGALRNIGLYGNTTQASRSNTNRWLLDVTAMLRNTRDWVDTTLVGIMHGNINLTWGYGGEIAANELVRLEYSPDDGNSWTRIGDTSIGAREYFWPSDLKQAGIALYPSSPAARWRLYLQSDTNVWHVSGRFGLRNRPFSYFLNDTSLVNDVYTTAIGDDDNGGYLPSIPKLTMNALLIEVDMEPTDQVYIDTGVYWMLDTNAPILWEASDAGDEGGALEVYGSTHDDGSVFVAIDQFVADYLFLMEASYVDLQGLGFSGENVVFAGNSLDVQDLVLTNSALRMSGDDSFYADIQVDHGGILLSGQNNGLEQIHQRWGEMELVGTNITIQYSSIYTTNQSKTAVVVRAVSVLISNCTVVASEGTALSKLGYGTLRLGHNTLVAGGDSDSSVISWGDGGLISDWNNLLARDSAWVGIRNGKWEKLAYWQEASELDANSVSFDPLFQNEAHGDFHLNSTTGRWSTIFQTWDVDATQSPLIDMGDPWIGTREEPMPNGYRRNIGAYGGTAFASKSISSLWLTALTQNDGGVLKGTDILLRWAAGNAGDKTVTLQYYDGSVWTNIATGLTATEGSYVWDSTGFADSFDAYWRITAEDGSGTSDQTDEPFALRNQTHAFYVNDADLTDDIYCSAIGSSGNDGLTPGTPKIELQEILDAFDLEGGDAVYLDTGSYPSSTDILIIWSRSGSTNADVVIQGNTNGAFTLLERTGSTNYPAIGMDVKASQIQLRNFAIGGVNRAILMESNRNILVQGVVVRDAQNGLVLDGSQQNEVRNSAFWNTAWGITLENTKTSVLENLTFAKSTLAGIRLENTQVDTMQNNIFIPEADAYAYWIGTMTSLLTSATMDYNLYDFSPANSGFYSGATNDLRKYQLALDKDYRSAITNADLQDIGFSGDFHPQSEVGRWTAAGWVQDGTTSWAVDHGNPDFDYSEEPETNGERINIGMYGNTVQASLGDTNLSYTIRSLNEEGIVVPQSDQIWPMIWSTHLVDDAEMVLVQFSGDSGASWTTLTNISAYTEYYVWQARPQYQTVEGRWRVIGVTDTNLLAVSPYDFVVRYTNLNFVTGPSPVNGLAQFTWEGGVQGLHYRIEYSDDFGQTWNEWEAKYNGPAQINKSNFLIPAGSSQLIYTFEDRTSYLRRTRWYRIWEIQE